MFPHADMEVRPISITYKFPFIQPRGGDFHNTLVKYGWLVGCKFMEKYVRIVNSSIDQLVILWYMLLAILKEMVSIQVI